MACPSCNSEDYYYGLNGHDCANPICSLPGKKKNKQNFGEKARIHYTNFLTSHHPKNYRIPLGKDSIDPNDPVGKCYPLYHLGIGLDDDNNATYLAIFSPNKDESKKLARKFVYPKTGEARECLGFPLSALFLEIEPLYDFVLNAIARDMAEYYEVDPYELKQYFDIYEV